MNYAKAIRIVRSISDITQKELADRSGLDRSYLSLIESSKRKPTIETLQTISEALEVPFHLLTLLAVEKIDTKRINEEQVLGLAKELTALLLKKPSGDRGRRESDETSGRKSTRSGIPPRIKKNRSERAA
jgi:transcriptional regulator with XRE-family HTH domain